MKPHQLRCLVLEHAALIQRADTAARTALRLDRTHEPERAEMARDEASDLRFRAECLAELLAPHGVHQPDPRQLSLLSDGGAYVYED